MVTDQQGNTLSNATLQAAEYFNEAVASFNTYSGDPLGAIDKAIAEAPDFAMARIARAHMFATATEPALTQHAFAMVRELKAMRLDARETSHVQALEQLLAGRWTDAALQLDMHNVRHPHDILALQCGHLLDFYRGSARNLRDRIARVLPQWPADMPGYPILLGMYAFGLEETGDYAKAEEYGRRATELQPLDSWAHHAVAHVFEMQGRPQDGAQWMMSRQAYWAREENFFKVHNWWHHALYMLELGDANQALAVYDAHIRKEHGATVLELIDASAMLWRLELAGVDVGNRWAGLANDWDAQADGRSYTFNDWHAVMAYLGAGRDNDAERIIADFQRDRSARTEVDEWTQSIALPLAHGFVAFWRKDHETAIQQLHGVRYIANRFGGSHAQRDIIDLTLLVAALRGGQADLAEALANERIALKPDDLMNRSFLARIQETRSRANAKAA
jgi:tetratricopeptide (TPR) repeat protein